MQGSTVHGDEPGQTARTGGPAWKQETEYSVPIRCLYRAPVCAPPSSPGPCDCDPEDIRFNALASYRRLQGETLGEFSVFIAEEERAALALAAMQVDREQMGRALAVYAGQSLASPGAIMAANPYTAPRDAS
ncbi:MAG: hypothetical protein KF817_03840 [Phycisphaeraceae bacterium]|nr:hypothetical protein [Phycisphaeraceae bacterium]